MDVKAEASVTTCAHQMDTALWSGLPEELQELVFLCLPWPQIYRVRILSKGWNEKLMSGTKGSQLQQACARAQPKLFALLAPGGNSSSNFHAVNMFDSASNRWHTFETSMEFDPEFGEAEFEVVCASDGGLVCSLSEVQSKSKKTHWHVSVSNPLTQVWKQLPPLCGLVQGQIMMQLIMDRKTKHYRVIVVGYDKDPEVKNLVRVYHSETGQWTKASGSSSGEVVYGHFYNSKPHMFDPVPYSYSFADGLLREIGLNVEGNFGYDQLLVKDHLFCLKELEPEAELQTHSIVEYQAAHCGASWSLLKEYPFDRLPTNPHLQPDAFEWFPDIFVCKDFLLLFVFNELGKDNLHDFMFVYEFSREEWRELPVMPGGYDLFLAQRHMCELHFDSFP